MYFSPSFHGALCGCLIDVSHAVLLRQSPLTFINCFKIISFLPPGTLSQSGISWHFLVTSLSKEYLVLVVYLNVLILIFRRDGLTQRSDSRDENRRRKDTGGSSPGFLKRVNG